MIIIAYVLVAVFLIVEGRLRQGREAASFEAGYFDRNSTKYVGFAFGTALVMLILAPILNYFQVAGVSEGGLQMFGLALMVIGLALRYWASKTLGAFYTRTLLVKTDHHIVESGPYRLIRNPGYLGVIVLFVGASLAASNWLVVAVITSILLASYMYRIRVEETMLQTTFGEEYQAYKARTWKLVPLVY
jgi:protein-S-isoprenylcysteine O-methyltransferase Ste14